MRLNDIILFVVVFGSMGIAVWQPGLGEPFHPHLLKFMMSLLFLSFLRIDFSALLETSVESLRRLVLLVACKLVLLPVGLYFVTLWISPDYAIPVLLLSGVSTGVVAPFMGSLINADGATVLRMVIVTSVLVPFSLPGLVKILEGSEMTIALGSMIGMLAQIIFVPMAAVLICRRFIPGVLTVIMRWLFPLSIVLFAVVNLGVFSRYSSFFYGHPGQIAVCVGIAYLLSVAYYAGGFALTFREQEPQRLAGGVSQAIVNNVLIIVFASEYFGPLAATLAAVYMFPFFTMIVPMKLMSSRLNRFAMQRQRSV